MKIILSTLVLLLSFAFAQAQDSTLPKGNCVVYLLSGKKIKDIRLWKIENGKVEYEKEGNLHDIAISEVNLIQTFGADYTFSDSATLYKVPYDLILMENGDSIYCFIKEIGPRFITYQNQGEEHLSSVERYAVKKHFFKGRREEAPVEQNVAQNSAQSVEQTVEKAPQVEVVNSTPEASHIDYFTMGKLDGQKEFKGYGSTAGGIACGFIPIVGWAAGAVSLLVPPNANPTNTQLFTTNREYCRGYKQGAHLKKVRRTLGGACIGVCFFLIALAF